MSSPLDLREQLELVLGADYAVERELAAGGMSRLFLAIERSLRRPVVIKVLPRELTSEVSAARFQREIELAAQLQHPHILPVLAAGTRGGLLYYIMPYLAGESLRRRLQRDRRLALGDALRVLREIADALAYAHRCGVVHRDIKPDNILLEERHAVLTDFGIARAMAEPVTGDRLTATGLSVGTPGYMAPEQAAGERVIDARADLYSLAVVGYEMLAGAPPFTGPNAQAVLAAHLTAAPEPLASLRPEVPNAVAAAIHRALAKAPEERFSTAAEFRDALSEVERIPETAAAARGSRGGLRSLGTLIARGRALIRGSPGNGDGGVAATPRRPVSRFTVAVLPFTVRGSERLAYLGEGLVDLLSARLDGAGDYCVADPRAILGIAEQMGRRPLDPTRGREVAERLRAGRFVLGSLVEAGGRLHLTASMYDDRETLCATGQATVGEEAQIFELVDEVAIQLLAGEGDGERVGAFPLASATTHSLAALRAYLEGERHFRRGQFTAARDAFQRAVDADPTFARAWYRLSVAAEWAGQRELQDEAAEEALHRSGRLSAHDRRLLQAFVAWRRGDPSAEAQYRNILGTHPNDVEAWFQLGEVLFHYGPLRGRSFVASREAWERVLSFEPRHLGALHHLARIAALEGKRAELDELTNRVLEISPEGERAIEMEALRAFTVGDTVQQRRIIEQLRHAPDITLIITIRTLVANRGDLDGAHRLACLATEPSRDAAVQTLGHVQCAYLHVARGQWRAAKASLRAAAALDEGAALEARGLLSALPFLPVPRHEVEEVRDALLAWDAAAVPELRSPSMFLRIHNGVHEQIRAYLLGLLHARLDEYEAAARQAAVLSGMGGTRLQRALSGTLAAGIRAELAWRRGAAAEALAALEHTAIEMSYDPPMASPFYSGSRERFLRAELLATLGSDEEALRWYDSFAEISLYDVVYEAVSHARRAAIHERRGEERAAKEHERRFAALWAQCDEEVVIEQRTANGERRT